jgi:hypothetical protein
MVALNRLIRPIMLAAGLAVVQLASPVRAAVFNFSSSTSSNSSIKSYLDSGINLVVANSNSTGNNNPNTLNTRPDGLCAWAAAGTSGQGRCGYGSATNSGISSFTLQFDKSTTLTSFNVTQFQTPINPTTELTQATIAFSLDNINFSPVVFNGTGSKSFSFFAPANQLVYVQTAGTFSSANTLQTGEIRLGSLTTTEPVPAPLPMLGVVLGFRVSRQIRKRIANGSRQA